MNAACRNLPLCVLIVAAGLAASLAPDREQARAFFREGNGLLDQERFSEAAAAYDRAIGQDPSYAEAYHNRGIANEMVDRAKALQDYRRFIQLAADIPELKYDVARVQARLQILESLPKLPESIQPSHYVAEVGDYYRDIARASEGERWNHIPVKVFLGSAPKEKWQEGTREAFDAWGQAFPLELVALPQNADIRMGWEESVLGLEHAGEAYEWVRIRREGGELTGRRIAVIVVNLGPNWSKKEMRAIVLHEMGHALGIKGHSTNRDDIMFGRMQERSHVVDIPIVNFPMYWRSLPKEPSQRDVNTLIRLYNSGGPFTRFR